MRINFSSDPGLRFWPSLRILMLGVLPFAAFIAEAQAQSPDQPSSLPGFTIVYEQTTAASENGVKRLRGIHVRYQRSDCWAKEVRTYFDETGTPRPSQIEQYLKRDHRSYSAEALRKNPSFDREEKVLGIEAFVLHFNQGNGGDDYTEIFLAPELQGVQIKQVIVKQGTRDLIEPVSILRGEPDEKTLVRETSKGTQKKVDFTYGVLQGFAFKKVQPSYPVEANAAGVVGAVQVQILISETGTVIDAVPISGPPLLHAKALEAARQWAFRPTEISTETVKVQDTLTFNFAPQ